MEKHIPIIALCALVARGCWFGMGIGDALGIIGVSVLFGFFHFMEHKKKIDIDSETKKQIEQLRTEFQEMRSKVNMESLTRRTFGK